ncbi:MAG TPA: protein kinase [Terriglobales bacterium]|nr:protein kinase [Terriglobales bacterium]
MIIGQILGHYRIVAKIGAGGMGEVYRASDDRLGREVAVKVLTAALATDQDRLRRFEQEARAAAALNHPNIVAIYDIGVHEGVPYIVSELLEGQTLRQRLVLGPLSSRLAADYGGQVAQGLVAAHEKHIVHRDLKPENLFITRDSRVKILDFGIAKLTSSEAADGRSIESRTTQTRAGTVLGTVAYMSPEQIRSKPVDHRSDIFSFGAILYEMVTGRRAFKGETEADTMMAVLSGEPPDISMQREGIPPAFDQIVRHCVEKDPDNRFQSARDLAFALSTVTTSGTLFLPRRGKKRRVFKWLPWAVAALALTAAAIFLGMRLRPASQPIYQRITFERGTVYAARFSHMGQGILYAASWNGRPLQLYSSVGQSPLTRPLGLPSAGLLAVSSSDELALVLHGTPDRREFTHGILARAPLAGGTPREVLDAVRAADWSPHGDLAVVHFSENQSRLEFPIGKVLARSAGWIDNIRFSPDGDKIAYMDHPINWADAGSVCVTDLEGNKTVLSSGWQSEDGLDWSPGGSEIWFTATRGSGSRRALWAVSPSGRLREVLSVPASFTLQDIAPDGRVVITLDAERMAMEWTGQDPADKRDLSWYDWSIAKDISLDGQWVLFEESGEPAGPNSDVAIRKIDGSPPIRLGEGTVGDLSPDGKWAVAVLPTRPPRVNLLPVGPGQARQFTLSSLEYADAGEAHFLPEGKQIIICGNEPGHQARTFLMDAGTGHLRAITAEGVRAALPSPDGKYLAGAGPDGHLQVFPIGGGPPTPVPNNNPGLGPYNASQWSADSKALFVYRTGGAPLEVYRVELATGKTTPQRTLLPRDPAGVIMVAPVVTNLQGTEFAYSYYQILSVLYIVSGLR